jgi:hypothetical protein
MTTTSLESIAIDNLIAVTAGAQTQSPNTPPVGFDRQGNPLQRVPPVGTDMFDTQGHLVGCDAFPQGDPRSCF